MTDRLWRDPFGGVLDLKFSGGRSAGILEFFLASVSVGHSIIPRKPWGTLLVLAEFAKKYSSSSAFLTSTQLAYQLKIQDVLKFNDPQNAIRTIHRLREKLGQLTIAEKLVGEGHLPRAGDFGAMLVQHSKVLGYRLSLPSEHLIIELDRDD